MLSVGLVGLPNAGKSTLFNLLTKRQVPAENFPFCTIDPSSGIVEVPDPRLAVLGNISKSQKLVHAAIEFTDIAGLVKNAHQGEGLGNQFLSNIQQSDLILMVIRCFENDNIIHVENRVNPIEDEEILILELTSHDQNKLEKMLPKLQKESKKDPFGGQKIEILEKLLSTVSQLELASSVQFEGLDPEILKWRKSLNLLTDKPILRLANINNDGQNMPYKSDFNLDILQETEAEGLEPTDREELGLDPLSGLDKMIKACFQKLGLATYLTTGEMETKAWTFPLGMDARNCAGLIHTDFSNKFIKAEVVKYKDFVEYNGWKSAYDNGQVRSMGKDYLMEDGDVVEFKLNG